MLQNLTTKIAMAFDKKRWRVFADWLKTERENANLSQDGLADLVGVDRQTIYRLENTLSGTKRQTVVAIAEALKADIAVALNKAGFAIQDDELIEKVPKPIIEAIGQSGYLTQSDFEMTANFIRTLNEQRKKEKEQ